MSKMVKEYILLAGYRRFNAIKKLGWKRVSCKVYGTDDAVTLPVNDIELGENSRIEESSTELTELMQSIKQNGLLQPLVVAKSSELTEEDFVALNLTENIQRKDLSPHELSLKIRRLVQLGLSSAEISVRLSISLTRVKTLMNLSNAFDAKDMEKIAFQEVKGSTVKKGIPYTIAKQLATVRISKKARSEVLDKVSSNEIRSDKVKIIADLIKYGMKPSIALKKGDEYMIAHLALPVNKKTAKNLMSENGYSSVTSLILGMLYGKIALNSDMFFKTRDLKKVSDE